MDSNLGFTQVPYMSLLYLGFTQVPYKSSIPMYKFCLLCHAPTVI